MRQPSIVTKANNLYKAITGKPGKLDAEAFSAAERRKGVPQEVAKRFIAKYADRLKGLTKKQRGHATCNVITVKKSKTGKKSKVRAAKKNSRTGKRK